MARCPFRLTMRSREQGGGEAASTSQQVSERDPRPAGVASADGVSMDRGYDTVIHVLRRRTLVRVLDAGGIEVDSYIDDGSAVQPEPVPGNRHQGAARSDCMLTVGELAEALAVSIRTIRRMVDDGQIPYLMIRSQLRFHLPDVINALRKGGPCAQEKNGLGPRPAPGPLQENPQGSALLGDPEEDRRNDVPQVARLDEQGAGHHRVPQGTRSDPRRVAILRPNTDGE